MLVLWDEGHYNWGPEHPSWRYEDGHGNWDGEHEHDSIYSQDREMGRVSDGGSGSFGWVE